MYREIARVIRTRPLSSLGIFCDYLEERGELHRLDAWWYDTLEEFHLQMEDIIEETLLSGEATQGRPDLTEFYLRGVIQQTLEQSDYLEELLWDWVFLHPCPQFVPRVAYETLAREFPIWDWKQFPPPGTARSWLDLRWD